MKPPLTYRLKHEIVLTTRSADDGSEKDEVLKPAGTCVVLRRPKAKDLRVVDDCEGKPVAMALALIKKVSNLEEMEVENLDAEDMAGLGELVADFMPDGRKTGKTS